MERLLALFMVIVLIVVGGVSWAIYPAAFYESYNVPTFKTSKKVKLSNKEKFYPFSIRTKKPINKIHPQFL